MTPSNPVRDALLAKIRGAVGGDLDPGTRTAAVAERLANPPTHALPARTSGDAAALRAQFFRYLEGQSATVLSVNAASDVPAAIAGYLRDKNLPARVRMGTDAILAAMPWRDSAPGIAIDRGPAIGSDDVGVSHAAAGVSETGTLALFSGPDNPVTVTFLPETHIVVVNAADIVGSYEGAWAKARARFGRHEMPRTLNFVSGPSRTGDIGGKLVMGAHGPKRLCVIVVG